MSQGKGISDAVRQVIPQWMDQETINAIKNEASKEGVSIPDYYLDDSKNWARNNRRSITGGFVRTYRNNAVPAKLGLELEIQSNSSDTEIKYFILRMAASTGKKVITGGDCRVASVLVTTNKPNAARLGSVVKEPLFKRLSQTAINKIMVQTEFGDGFDQLFDERD